MIHFIRDLIFGSPEMSLSLTAGITASASGIWSIEWLAFVAAGSAFAAGYYTSRTKTT